MCGEEKTAASIIASKGSGHETKINIIAFLHKGMKRVNSDTSKYEEFSLPQTSALPGIIFYTRRFAPRAASAARYARSRGRMEQLATKTDRDVHDFRCKSTTCECRELHAPRKQSGRRLMPLRHA